jgi:hypothetical protein
MDRVSPIVQLLQRASAAHGEYETTVLNGVYDQEWPIWYAQWAVEQGLNNLVGSSMTAQEWSNVLFDLNEQHKLTDKSQSWAEFTAHHMVHMFS